MASLRCANFVVIRASPVHQREPTSFHCHAQQSHSRAQNQRRCPRPCRWTVAVSGFTAGPGGRRRPWLGRQDEHLDELLANPDAGLPELLHVERHCGVDTDLSPVAGGSHGRGQGGAASQVQQIRQRLYPRVLCQLLLLRAGPLRLSGGDSG